MSMTSVQRKKAAQAFAQRWAKEPGGEKQQAASFWLELASEVLEMARPTQYIFFEEQTNYGGYIDAKVPDAKAFIEQKSRGADLDKKELRQGELVTPFEQARNYANAQKNSDRPLWIVVSNFDEIRVHNLDVDYPEKNYTSFQVGDLADNLHHLDFLIDPTAKRLQFEREVSWEAGELIGELYGKLLEQYDDPDSDESQHSLNVLSVRLVFCLFAEDAEVFPKNAFHDYLAGKDPSSVRRSLHILYKHLNTPTEEQDKYDEELKKFPYVNGGLFADDVEIPSFTEDIVELLVTRISAGTDWSKISPTIFGGVFESTLNPEVRRKGGMHYTSPENIHKVIDPLFLDALKNELDSIVAMPNGTRQEHRARNRALTGYQEKLASLKFFDPACGSGNFLTETYMSLRRLENVVLTQIMAGQTSFGFEDVAESPVKVHLQQFHGIEINDFAVSVAETALWIAELQANMETEMIVTRSIEDLPLRDSAHIVKGNALTVPWEDVLPRSECNYIIGNPPFIGKMTPKLQAERALWFKGATSRIDYVGCWFKAAAQYMHGTKIEAALVATNSICQGVQVTPLWKPLFEGGLTFNFAHRSFLWEAEGRKGASVVVVVIGFSYMDREEKWLWDYSGKEITKTKASRINEYLVDHQSMFMETRSTPLDNVPLLINGTKPAGKALTFTVDEYATVVKKYPATEKFFRKYLGATELTNSTHKYILWVEESDLPEVVDVPVLADRLKQVSVQRADTSQKGTYALRDKPWEMFYVGDPDGEPFLVVPCTTSGARRYFPMGFVEDDTLPSNAVFFLTNATIYDFGILTSRFHNTWLNEIGGKLKVDFRYANTLVYNNYIWPTVTKAQREEITHLAQAVLGERAKLETDESMTFNKMYKPGKEWAYPALFAAHTALDEAVERAYGLEPGCDEKDIIFHLFNLYEQRSRDECLTSKKK